jgi:D-xylose transport system permease protein
MLVRRRGVGRRREGDVTVIEDGGPDRAPDPVVPEPGAHHPAETSDTVAPPGTTVRLEVVDSLGEYLRTVGRRLRGGESGMLPVFAALVLIVIVFQVETTKYLSGGDIVDILALASVYVMFGASETFALVLSEIDLSIAAVAFVGAMVMTELLAYPNNWPWWAAVVVGAGVCTLIGILQGTLITRVRIPSFVVTLAGFLGWHGFLIFITDIDRSAVGGVLSVPSSNVIWAIVNEQMSPTASWILLAVAVTLFGAYVWVRDARRRSGGLSAPPPSITLLVIVAVAAAGVVLVWICNFNRGTAFVVHEGLPYFVPVVAAVLVGLTVLFGRTRFGRYMYAIGANPEAARRAGINVALIRTAAFGMCGLTAFFAGVLYTSLQGSISITATVGTWTLLGVAAAVIGGTSLFGGRGKPVYSVLGGVTVAALFFGLDLLGVSADGTYMAIGVMLVAAAAVDAIVRRRRATSAV